MTRRFSARPLSPWGLCLPKDIGDNGLGAAATFLRRFCYRLLHASCPGYFGLRSVSYNVLPGKRQISTPRSNPSNARRREMGREDLAQTDPRRRSWAAFHDLVPRQLSERGESGIPATARGHPEISRWLLRHVGARGRSLS